MLNIFAFSKDRACQCDSLIRSVKENIKMEHEINVLYNYENEEYKAGYDDLIAVTEGVNFIKETDYYQDTLRISLDEKYDCFLWLIDDCIMKNSLFEDSTFKRFMSDDAIGIYNLRMTPTMNIMSDMDMTNRKIPTFLDTYKPENVWEWKKATDNYWGDPVTMDGHMYKTQQMKSYLHGLPKFTIPPSMDTTMHENPLDTELMICNSQQKLVGIAPNRVQTGWPNVHGNVTTKELNDIWLSGKRIDLNSLYNLNENIMRYQLMPLTFEDRA